jgi:cardiolipin synthase
MGFSASNFAIDLVFWSARHLPNLISVIRVLLVVPIVISLERHELPATLSLFAVAAASDAADGYLAKRFGWQSELGSVLDPIADKVLMVTVFVTLSALKLVPMWLTATVVIRDAIIVLGAAAYRYFIGPVSAHPSAISKINTLCQAAFILAVVGQAQFSALPTWVAMWLGSLVFATVMVSGFDYVLVYGRRAAQA